MFRRKLIGIRHKRPVLTKRLMIFALAAFFVLLVSGGALAFSSDGGLDMRGTTTINWVTNPVLLPVVPVCGYCDCVCEVNPCDCCECNALVIPPVGCEYEQYGECVSNGEIHGDGHEDNNDAQVDDNDEDENVDYQGVDSDVQNNAEEPQVDVVEDASEAASSESSPEHSESASDSSAESSSDDGSSHETE